MQAPAGAALDRSEGRSRERQEASQRREAERDRRAFLGALLAQRIPKADIWSIVCSQFLAGARSAQVKGACDLLGLEPLAGQYGPDHRRALELSAAGSSVTHDRAVLALALAAGDEALRFGNEERPTAAVVAHTEFLTAYGWKADSAAQAQPGEPAPAPA